MDKITLSEFFDELVKEFGEEKTVAELSKKLSMSPSDLRMAVAIGKGELKGDVIASNH